MRFYCRTEQGAAVASISSRHQYPLISLGNDWQVSPVTAHESAVINRDCQGVPWLQKLAKAGEGRVRMHNDCIEVLVQQRSDPVIVSLFVMPFA